MDLELMILLTTSYVALVIGYGLGDFNLRILCRLSWFPGARSTLKRRHQSYGRRFKVWLFGLPAVMPGLLLVLALFGSVSADVLLAIAGILSLTAIWLVAANVVLAIVGLMLRLVDRQ